MKRICHRQHAVFFRGGIRRFVGSATVQSRQLQRTFDRFRAAVVVKPVINWTSFVLTGDMNNYFYKYWFGDLPWENIEAYWKRSPLAYVGNVKTPTMLMTGEVDYRTPSSEAEQFYQALKLHKVDTAMVRPPGGECAHRTR